VKAVFDASVIAAAVGWQGEGWLCLVQIARRRAFPFGTSATARETEQTCLRLIRERSFRQNAAGRLTWYLDKLRLVDPAPLGKPRSRDARDDPYLAAALGARAGVIVTYDKDLLVLHRPFGLHILRPSEFLRLVQP
jgi:predicted nucleic acid-binding protein